MNVRENWRILLLLVLVVASTVALFAPTGAGGAGNASDGGQAAASGGPTNLKYGLELSGGTRVRAPLVGMTASGVDVPPEQQRQLEGNVSSGLGLGRSDIRVDPQTNTVEVFATAKNGNVTRAEFARQLQQAGYDVSEGQIRNGVTQETRDRAVRVLNNKINRGGLTGGSAQVVTTPTGEAFILVEVPNANRSEVIDLIGQRGTVEIVAVFPASETDGNQSEYRRVSLLTQGDFATIGTAQQGRGREPPYVPVSLNDEAAQNFSNAMRQFGFTSRQGTDNCRYHETPNDPGYCLLTVQNNQTVFASSMGGDLATTINNKQFASNPAFQMTASNMSDARQLELNLQAGALPTNLDIANQGTTYYLEPALAQEFKLFSAITGIIAVLAVSLIVFLRYGSLGVALPMLLAAGAEVYLLLGFAAAVGLALDLSHIAGLIAVIGTGVDDLIIIADEILQSGDVKTSRVFQSRFRKAFWVIGAAAATTIVAMSPLAVLSLGDLQGFAIITIVGVLIGVLVTRPAYGDILRTLILD